VVVQVKEAASFELPHKGELGEAVKLAGRISRSQLAYNRREESCVEYVRKGQCLDRGAFL